MYDVLLSNRRKTTMEDEGIRFVVQNLVNISR